MCGLAGFLGYAAVSGPERAATALLHDMGKAIIHRGPDSGDVWYDPDLALGLSHRRLSIQDLSPHGAQPMTSRTGRFLIAFNGEIYNFPGLREELIAKGVTFRGQSDTEVMLAAFEAWGVESAIGRFAGMFAFALADLEARALYLVRDRMGEKPLYYAQTRDGWLFASELKALKQHPAFRPAINRNALTLLLRHNFIPAPHTIYEGVFKLPPAHLLKVSLDAPYSAGPATAYWSLAACFDSKAPASREQAVDQIESRLGGIIEEQMVSDVPLGAFLSGGIDSSTVVALMQQRSSRPVRSFTIGFDDPAFNEAEHARAVAEHLGTEHTELYVTPADALAVIPRLGRMYDEPFADSSQIPTFLVSQMTRQHVTVALSGDGGDELFCGYQRYVSTTNQWHARARVKNRLKAALLALPPRLLASVARRLVPGQANLPPETVVEKLVHQQAMSRADTLGEFYRRGVSYWDLPERMVLAGHEPAYALTTDVPRRLSGHSLQTLMWQDLNWYLPDDILVKVDRAAMASSLETRVPMLDHRFVGFALGLPVDWNMQNGVGKQLLRDVLYRHVPRALVDRPKRGFAVPLAGWLRGELRDWAEVLLDPVRLRREGFWNIDVLRRVWAAHVEGRVDYSFQLWGVLMFQAWLDEQG